MHEQYSKNIKGELVLISKMGSYEYIYNQLQKHLLLGHC
jgi:hypothetical protein